MGYYIDSLDVCFGTQLADSRGDIVVIYAHRLIHIFVLLSPMKTLGCSLKFFVLDLFMNLKLFDAYRIVNSGILVVTLEHLCDIRVN